VRGETTQQSRGLTRQAQAPRQRTLASGMARATEMAMRAIRPQRQEIRAARLGTHSDRARQKARLADVPTCCDGIADDRIWYSPSQSVTALSAGSGCADAALLVFAKGSERRTETAGWICLILDSPPLAIESSPEPRSVTHS
jgi:hypothetical protein